MTKREVRAILERAEKALNNLHGESTPEGSIVCDENGIVVFYCPKEHINDAKFAIAARADLPALASAYIAAMEALQGLRGAAGLLGLIEHPSDPLLAAYHADPLPPAKSGAAQEGGANAD